MELEDFFRTESPSGGFQSHRKAKVRADIAARLRKVCSNLPETDFQDLVDEIAERQLKSERRADW